MREVKRSVIVLLLLLIALPLFAENTTYDKTVSDFSELLLPAVSGKVVSFISLDSDSEEFTERFIYDVETVLINNDCTVVERRNVDSIIAELKFQTSGLVDDKSAASIGHMVGAEMVITGTARNMVDHYHVELRLLEVETGIVRRQKSYDLKYDSKLKAIMADKTSGVGTKRFSASTRLGVAFEFNRAHDDMVGEGVTPEEKSNNSFILAATAGIRILETLKLCVEADVYLNNGMTLTGMGYTMAFSYKTVDLPVFLSWSFIEKPFEVSVYGGAYASFSISDASFKTNSGSANVNVDGHVFGVLAGLNLSKPLGVGAITLDARYIQDFGTLTLTGDFGEGTQDYGLCIRKGVVATIGYSFAL